MDELQAAILRVKLPHVERWNQLRRQHAYGYNRLMADLPAVTRPHELTSGGPVVALPEPSGEPHLLDAVYHQYTIQVENRDAVSRELTEAKIGNAVYYPIPLHLQKVHARLGLQPGSFPNAESLSRRCLSLPIFPELTGEQQATTVASLKAACLAAQHPGRPAKAA